MPAPSLERSKRQAYLVCKLAKIALDAAVDMKQINFERSNGGIDFTVVDYQASGFSELNDGYLRDACDAADMLVNQYATTLARLAAYGEQ
jgi:hypothetical protein